MRRLIIAVVFAAPLLAILGCEGQPATRPEDNRFMLGDQGLPVGDPSADPFRPSEPVQLTIPAEPSPEKTNPYRK